MLSIVDDGDLKEVSFADTVDFDGEEADLQRVDIYGAATARNLERSIRNP